MPSVDLGRVQAALARLVGPRLRSVLARRDLTPGRIVVLYLGIGLGGHYLVGVYLPRTVRRAARLNELQAVAGVAEVLLTAGLIFMLTSQSRRAIEARNDRLDALHTERAVLHRVFRHNLRQEMNVILGYLELIRAEVDEERELEYCRKARQRIERIERYQRTIIDIDRLLDPATDRHRIDLVELIAEHRTVLAFRQSEAVSITLDLPERAVASAVPGIEAALHEVLDNARTHNTAAEPRIRVSVEERGDDRLAIVVDDNGPGISAYERQAIEDADRERSLTHSSGLGLWLTKLACSISGGTVTMPPTADGGRVVLELPKAAGSPLSWLFRAA